VTGLGRALRAIAGIAIVVLLLFTVNSWLGQYKVASKKAATQASKPSTVTTEPSATMPVQGVTVSILEAEPLRATPGANAKILRTLRKGEQLLLVGLTQDNWLQARDSDGKVGYIVNDKRVARVKK
jgi:cytoskeletal protein RodZ